MRETWIPKTRDDFEVVRLELEEIIASEQFRSSTRYPAFLRHIVEKTLVGEIGDLKERTIGVEVFHREPEYSTSDDPVVRVCGSEVRRRIAQFYAQGKGDRAIEIEIPPGGYVAQFRRSVKGENEALETQHDPHRGPALVEQAQILEEQIRDSAGNGGIRSQLRGWVLSFCTGVLAALLVVAGLSMIERERSAQDPLMQVWNPLLASPNPVLISVGRPHPPGEQDLSASQQLSIGNRIIQPSYRISITAVAAISHVAGFLVSHKKPFHVHESDSSGLDDLHQMPLVLINGNDNKWTALILRPLRFHFVQQNEFSHIEDSQHPEQHDWRVDFSQPYLQETADYAIVGRFYCPTTESTVIVIAGISSTGTEAAGEFMASSERLEALARDAHSSLEKNFEAVLKVEVVGGNPGAVSVVASQFW